MKILVVGSHGMLGRKLVNHLTGLSGPHIKSTEIITADRENIDITHSINTSRYISRILPDIIVNCAAFSNVDACETYVSEAFATNATGAKNLALAGKQTGAKIIHISTDYVFDGAKNGPYTETDKPNPLSVYGTSKLEGERAVQEMSDNYAIIRTAWLFGPYKSNFVTTLLERGKKNLAVSVVTDQWGSPTYTADLSNALGTIILQDMRGLYHITNAGCCSRYEWAKTIFEITGDPVSVHPLKTSDYQRAARVPQNSSLDSTKYIMASGQKMRSWQEALKEYMSKTL